MYNPMIMQASCTMYALVAFCNGENEEDLRSILFPISTPLESEDFDDDNPRRGGKAGNLIGMLGRLPGGIGTLVDVTQLLTTMQKALMPENEGVEVTETDDPMSDQSGILGPPPPVSSKQPPRAPKSMSDFAFNHVLASHIQAQLFQRMMMSPDDEPIPPEARLPVTSLGSVVRLFDLPLIRPLIAKSAVKTADGSSETPGQQTVNLSTPNAAAGGSILGEPPAPRFRGPPGNAPVAMAPPMHAGNVRPPQGPPVRPLAGRNFAGGANNWPRPGTSAAPKPWTDGKGFGSENSGSGWQGQYWNSGTEDPTYHGNPSVGLPGMKPRGRNVGNAPRQPSMPNTRGPPPQVWL